jgi:hypothetical protein
VLRCRSYEGEASYGLSGDVPTAVSELKQQPGRELKVHGAGGRAKMRGRRETRTVCLDTSMSLDGFVAGHNVSTKPMR